MINVFEVQRLRDSYFGVARGKRLHQIELRRYSKEDTE